MGFPCLGLNDSLFGYQRTSVEIGALRHQHRKQLPVEHESRPVQRRATEDVRLIGVKACGEQLAHDI